MDDINWDTVTITVYGTSVTFWQACAILGGIVLAGFVVLGVIVLVVVASAKPRE